MIHDEDEEPEGLPLRKVVATVWAALALGLLGCMGIGRLGGVYWAFDLFNHFYLQYAAIGIVGAVVALVLRTRVAAVLFVAAFGIAAFQLAPLFQSPGAVAREGKVPLRVLALNVLTANLDFQRVVDWLISEDADVLVLQETNQTWTERLGESLLAYDRLDTATVREDNFGLSVYVRSGLDVGEVTVLSDPAPVPWIDVELTKNGRAFHLIALHTIPPIGPSGTRERRLQLEALAERARTIVGPVVVAGDLNATLWSSDLEAVLDQGRLRPASLGFGLQGTWPSSLWFTGMIQIDHVLVTSSVTVKDFHVGVGIGSDHRGVVATLVL